jgi:hypothetical protein
MDISSEEPGLLLTQETSDTDSSASVYSSNRQMSNEMDPKMTLAAEAPFAEGIANEVKESAPLSHTGGKVKWSSESMEKELAEAKAENAKLRADLEKERSERKLSANRQDDPFAPREGKTLVWTGVTMTLVRSKSLLFEDSTLFDTSLTMLLILYSFINTRYDSLRKAKDQHANCSTMSGARSLRKRLPPSWGPRELERLPCSTF